MTELESLEAFTSSELTALFEKTQKLDSDRAVAILKLIAERAYADEDYQAMASWNQKLAEFAEDNLHLNVAADAQYLTGLAHFLQDDESTALNHYQIAESMNVKLGRDSELLDCLMNQMDCYECLEYYEKIIRVGERALNVARVGERFWAAGQTALKIAAAYYFLDEDGYSDLTNENKRIALQYAEEAVEHFANSGDTEKEADAYEEVSDLLTSIDRDSEALEKIEIAIALLKGIGVEDDFKKQSLSGMLLSKGRILTELKEYELAIDTFNLAIAIKSQMSEDLRDDEKLSLIHWSKSSALNRLGRNTEALAALEIALNTARLSEEFWLYYRIMQEQVWVLYKEDRDLEALFISRGAIAEYETQTSKLLPSPIFVGFIISAGLCLSNLERWSELYEVLEKVRSVNDYLIPLNRVIRLDLLKATALYQLGKHEDALILLDLVLEEIDKDLPDEDIAECFEIRGKIKFEKSPNSAVADLQLAVEIYNLTGHEDSAQELISKYSL